MVSGALGTAFRRIGYLALTTGPAAMILALHFNQGHSPAPPQTIPTALPADGPKVVAWERTPMDLANLEVATVAEIPQKLAVELPSTKYTVPVLTHAAFVPAAADQSLTSVRGTVRSWILYDPAHHVRAEPHRTVNQLMMAAPEVSLLSPADRTSRLFKTRSDSGEHPVLAYFDNRADLAGMPVLRGDDCRQAEHRSGNFSDTAKKLRSLCGSIDGHITRYSPSNAFTELQNGVEKLPTEQVTPLLLQMLQCERPEFRRLLVAYARTDPRPETTRVLAQRAVFEPEPTLRREAVAALAGRTPAAARPLLLAALRHPWPAIADQAAAALIELRDFDAVPALVDQLEEPDPTAPYDDGQRKVVREVVRINHAHNCQLCHAPSWDAKDPATVTVPSPTEPLPPSFSVQYYTTGDQLVRADVTYLRQDFSMTLPVTDPGPWPKEQRFDFFVRTRPALPADIAKRPHGPDPHRAAVARALRAITGRDFGDPADEWRAGLRQGG